MSQSKFTASERGLVGAICSIYGLNYNTVSAQINPNNDSHALSPDTIEYALINEHNLNRNTFLQTVKKLEKAELLRIVKANGRGKTAKFLERVA